MTNTSKGFTLEEIKGDVIEWLENGFDGYYCDLSHEVFNTDYYVIFDSEARELLEAYGVFKALETVIDFEIETFGGFGESAENIAYLKDPVSLANMLYYVLGNQFLENVLDGFTFEDLHVYDDEATPEVNQAMIEYIKSI